MKEAHMLYQRYGDLTVEELQSMSRAERHRYYFWLYQGIGQLWGPIADISPHDKKPKKWPKLDDFVPGEWWMYNALHSQLMTMMDLSAGLQELLEEYYDEKLLDPEG